MALRMGAIAAAAGLLAAAVTTAVPAYAAAPGTPPESGCPAASQLLSVEWLEDQGPYMAPRQIDDAGNQDGLVCGKPVNQIAAEKSLCKGPCAVPVIYLFRDNELAG